MEIDWIPVTEHMSGKKRLIPKNRIEGVVQTQLTMGDADLITQINTVDEDNIPVRESIDEMFSMLNGFTDFTQELSDDDLPGGHAIRKFTKEAE